MAYIISLMDDSLSAAARGSMFPGALATKQQANVSQPKRVSQPRAFAASNAMDAEPVRMDRVRALRAAIADGSYSVSASDLADKILHTMLTK